MSAAFQSLHFCKQHGYQSTLTCAEQAGALRSVNCRTCCRWDSELVHIRTRCCQDRYKNGSRRNQKGRRTVCSAVDDVVYNASAQSEFLTNAAGVGYLGLVGYFLYKVFTRRAKRFTNERISGDVNTSTPTEDPAPAAEADPELVEPPVATALTTALGAVQALGLATGLYFFATKLDSAVLSAPLPDQYTTRNIAVAVRTIIRGLVYLVTFIFAANGAGLAALSIKLLIFGDNAEAPEEVAKGASLRRIPEISMSNMDDLLTALDDASDVDKARAALRARRAAGGGSGSPDIDGAMSGDNQKRQ